MDEFYESLVSERLWLPLGMTGSGIGTGGAGVRFRGEGWRSRIGISPFPVPGQSSARSPTWLATSPPR